MVTNPEIGFVLYAFRIFLPLPMGHGNAFVSRRVHPYLRCHFSYIYLIFLGRQYFLGKDVGHYLKPINNLLILSSLSQITLVDRKILVSN